MCKDKAVVCDDHHDLDIRNMNGIVGSLHSNLYSEKNDIRWVEGDKADINFDKKRLCPLHKPSPVAALNTTNQLLQKGLM